MLTVFARRALYNPPICGEEWSPVDPALVESDDETRGRITSAAAAAAEVRAEKIKLESSATSALVARLETTKRELQASIVGASDFRRFQISSLLADVDRLLAQARQEILKLARATYESAGNLGASHVNEAITAARIDVTTISGISPTLVNHAFENTAELLTAPMQQFRSTLSSSVRRLALNGETFGDGMAKLAREIGANGFDAAEFKAERMIRTELGRTFNGATYDRMLALADRIPALRKIWIRTGDGRTRKSHIKAGEQYQRGQGIAIKAGFHVGAAILRYPIDPLAAPPGKIAAAETIMCRCNAATDFDAAELQKSATTRIKLALGRGQFEEPEPMPKKAPKPAKPRVGLTAEAARKKLAKLGPAYTERIEALNKELGAIASDKAFATYIDASNKGLPEGARFGPLHQVYLDLKKQEDAIIQKIRDLAKTRDTAMRKVVQAPAGDRGKLTIRFGDNYSKAERKSFAAAVKEFEKLVGTRTMGTGPTWSDKNLGVVEIKKARDYAGTLVSRSYADLTWRAIHMGTLDGGVVVHELGHVLEGIDPEVHRKALAFLDARRGTEALRKLSEITGINSYDATELAWEDKFIDPYMGKNYESHVAGRYATEIVSMGIEAFYRNPLRLAAKDPEYFDFIFNLLRGK
jgi:hypothetical protein